MINRWLLVFALAGIPLLSAKTYDLSLTAPAVVHNLHLRAGQYRLKIEGSQVIFTDEDGNSVQTDVKVEQANKKFDDTEVETAKIAGTDHIKEIRLHGTKMELEFQ